MAPLSLQTFRRSLIYAACLALLLGAGIALYRGGVHLAQIEANEITVSELPSALALSFLRMAISYAAALIFAFITGILAARSQVGERILVPLLDIGQSIPIVGFFPAVVSVCLAVFNGHRLGVEMAACFLIFTSQVWNLAFAVYEALRSIPEDTQDSVRSLGVTGSLRFIRLYAPACVPRLVVNSVLSWSNGWFFLVASEIIVVGPLHFELPGIGSFLARAAEQDDVPLVLMGLAALTILILFLDQIFWRPASAWARRFHYESVAAESDDHHLRMPAVPKRLLVLFRWFVPLTVPLVWVLRRIEKLGSPHLFWPRSGTWFGFGLLGLGASLAVSAAWSVLWPPDIETLKEIPMALFLSTGRLLIALTASIAWTVPLALIVWSRPRLRQSLLTVAQIGASLPAIALFPLFVVVAVRKLGGGMELASLALVMTGMQWYLLFNCLGGVSAIPSDLAQAVYSLGLPTRKVWSRLVIPALTPALLTGVLTAWGGGWNALVVSEYVHFRGEVLKVNGMGALLSQAVYDRGDPKAVAWCLVALTGWILLLNALVWRPLHRTAIERCKFEG